MDVIDTAQEYQQNMIDDALARRRVPAIGRSQCANLDCGEPITPTRQSLGAQLCIDCASDQEQRARTGVNP